MDTILHALNALLMIGMPIALAVWLARKAAAPWRLFGVGLVTFVGSQVVHIPLNAGLTALFQAILPNTGPQPWHVPFNAVVLGLTAGVCEETARYIGYRWLAPEARRFRDALMLGAGHGGTEAIILGVLAGLALLSFAAARQMDLTTQNLTPAQLAQAQQQLAAYWGSPWYLSLAGALERFFALIVQLSLSVLVLQVFTRHHVRWLFAAIGFHLVADAVPVYAVQLNWPPMLVEALVGLTALAGLAIILLLRPRSEPLKPPEPEQLPLPDQPPLQQVPLSDEELARKIDASRYV